MRLLLFERDSARAALTFAAPRVAAVWCFSWLAACLARRSAAARAAARAWLLAAAARWDLPRMISPVGVRHWFMRWRIAARRMRQ